MLISVTTSNGAEQRFRSPRKSHGAAMAGTTSGPLGGRARGAHRVAGRGGSGRFTATWAVADRAEEGRL